MKVFGIVLGFRRMLAGNALSVLVTLALTGCGRGEDANTQQMQASTTSADGLRKATAQPPSAPSCYDVDKSEPAKLTGRMDYVVFPGPPNYEDVQNGDDPEPTFILRLHQPICIRDGDDGFADPDHSFTDVHVVAGQVGYPNLKRFVGHNVEISLYDQMAAETGHHHAPLVASAAAIKPEVAPQMHPVSEKAPTNDYSGPASVTVDRPFFGFVDAPYFHIKLSHAACPIEGAWLGYAEQYHEVAGGLKGPFRSCWFRDSKVPSVIVVCMIYGDDTAGDCRPISESYFEPL